MKYNKFYVIAKTKSGAKHEGEIKSIDMFVTLEDFIEGLMGAIKDGQAMLLGNTILRMEEVESFQVKIIMSAKQKEEDSNV